MDMGFIKDETPWQGGRVSQRVICMRADNPSPMTYVGTNTWIVAEPGADLCMVIDPAPAGAQVQRILEVCRANGLRVGAIVATHDHPDHIEGIPQLAQATAAPVYAPREQRIARLMAQSADLDVNAVGGGLPGGTVNARPSTSSVGRGCGALAHHLPVGPFCPFSGAPEFEVVSIPGHSQDSVGLLLPAEKVLFTGDVLFRHGPTVVFYPDGVLGSYFETLDKLEALVRGGEVQRFYPGHGYPIEDPLAAIEATREHRVDRLNQVREALASGVPANPDALFDAVYQGVDPALRAPSLRSIRAQLKYLGLEE